MSGTKRTRRFDKRSRNGCLTCKKRRVKCDEMHPKCNNCNRLKLNCSYGIRLLWEDEAIEKGISFGRSKQSKLIKLQNSRELLPDEEKEMTLSEMILNNKSVEWVENENGYNLFLNTNCKDFEKVSKMLRNGNRIKKNDNDQLVISLADEDKAIKERESGEEIEEVEEVETPKANNNYRNELMIYNASNNIQIEQIIGKVFSRSFSCPVNIFNDEFYHNNIKLEQEVFKYGISKIFPGCISYPKMNPNQIIKKNPQFNPYLSLIAPLARNSTIVFKTLVAVSSKQLSLLGSSRFENLSRSYTSEVLRLLPNLIKHKQFTNSNDWDDVLATVLMLCFADISSNCGESWLVHLNGAKEFLKDSSISSNITPLCKFFIRYFITHEILGQTAWSQNKIIPDDQFLESLKNDEDDQIDLVLGCSPHLISFINRISKLGEEYEEIENSSNFDINEQKILSERDNLESKLINLNQYLAINEIDKESEYNIVKIAEIKRLTALIYLFARVDLEFLYYNKYKTPKKMNENFKQVRRLTNKVIDLVNSLPSVQMSLLWTFFVIGIVSVENEDERWFVLNKFIEMEKLRELASVKVARKVVESVWKEKDLNCLVNRWKHMIMGKANTISLA